MVNLAPGSNQQPSVISAFSDLILKLFGPEVGAHYRSAVSLAELPCNILSKSNAKLNSLAVGKRANDFVAAVLDYFPAYYPKRESERIRPRPDGSSSAFRRGAVAVGQCDGVGR